MDFRTESLESLADSVRRGDVSAVELTTHALERIESLNPDVNAFVAVDGERALADAKGVDARRARGEELGPLAGIPIGVKDLDNTSGYITTYGSLLHAHDKPATTDSILVARLKEDGCVVVGKTNTPEFGHKGDTVNLLQGATRNPWSLAHSPGGSSGGSAAAVACGMVPLATGSDGGGSIRIPATCCGLTGMKPSLGRVPAGGPNPPDWHDLSTRGLMAMTAADIAYGLDAVIGPDPSDLRSLPMPEVSWLEAVQDPHVPLQVAWSPTLGYASVDAEVLEICTAAVRTIEGLGCEVIEVERVFAEDPMTQWITLVATYNWRKLSSVHGTADWGKLDPGVSNLAEMGSKVSGADVVHALDECHRMNLRLVELFHRSRLLVTPTIAAPPPFSGEFGVVNGQIDANWVRFTYPFNCTRSPAATVCVGFTSNGLPVGLQLVGPQHADQVVLRAAAAIEQAMGLNRLAPVGN
ncbi:MAG TPA: amidase family protein [Acidimicrobiales bacterium]|nr:amidase family protein [Acidimicrobiales bacterium]